MLLIKRYPNRKLYDTGKKQYVSLKEIAEMIREEKDVRVVDYKTGDDLTALTLTQIIFEQEKTRADFLPLSVLASLIRTGGDRLSALQRSLVTNLGICKLIDEEIERRINYLVKKGELDEGEGAKLRDKMASHTTYILDEARLKNEALERMLVGRRVSSGSVLQHLMEQIQELSAKIEEVEKR